MATRVLHGIKLFEQFLKVTTKGTFLWSLDEIGSAVYEEKSFKEKVYGTTTYGLMPDEKRSQKLTLSLCDTGELKSGFNRLLLFSSPCTKCRWAFRMANKMRPSSVHILFKRHLLQYHLANINETWQEYSLYEALSRLFKECQWVNQNSTNLRATVDFPIQ
jgi:sugar diacid utilization regulator